MQERERGTDGEVECLWLSGAVGWQGTTSTPELATEDPPIKKT